MDCTQRESMATLMWWQGTVKETESKADFLEMYHVFDRQPVDFLRSDLTFYCLFCENKQ